MTTDQRNTAGNGNSEAIECLHNYTPGERFSARIKSIRPEGVYIDRPGIGSGTISPRCWGEGVARRAALAKLRPGDEVEVEVVSWHPETKTLSLVRPGTKRQAPKRTSIRSPKPQVKLIPNGTVLLVDLANVLGAFSERKLRASFAVPLFKALQKDLTALGYKPHFLLERRALEWVVRCQTDIDKGRLFRRLCADTDTVSIVCGSKAEADFPLLQMASALPDSVCVSRDRFRDYATAFPDIVGTNRVRTFALRTIPGDRVPSVFIDGIKAPIRLTETEVPSEGVVTPTEKDADSKATPSRDPSALPAHTSPEPVLPQPIRKRETSIRRLSQLAKKDPENYFALAELYSASEDAEELKLSAKLDALGRKRMKDRRLSLIRDQRRCAMISHLQLFGTIHLSASRKRRATLLAAWSRKAV